MLALPRSTPLHYVAVAILLLFTIFFLYTVRDRLDVSRPGSNVEAHVQVKELPEFISSKPIQNVTKSAEPKIHLVVAATTKEDYSWAMRLNISGLTTIPYIADNPNSTYHPPRNKGHEAIMYLQYIYDYYDTLPEISVFSHATETAWHIEGLLHNMTFILQNLDFEEVKRRDYLNLRVNWASYCPNWLHIKDRTPNVHKPEQGYMETAFKELFPDVPVPDTWSAPCCSQFAVTRKAIRSVPRQRYADWIQWLMDTKIEDAISGRLWEHFWSFVFLGKAIDCPIEWKAYCQNYGICFESQASLNERRVLEKRVSHLRDTIMRHTDGKGESRMMVKYRKLLEELEAHLDEMMEIALERGRTPGIRTFHDEKLYND